MCKIRFQGFSKNYIRFPEKATTPENQGRTRAEFGPFWCKRHHAVCSLIFQRVFSREIVPLSF
jgi:hypothetical protein